MLVLEDLERRIEQTGYVADSSLLTSLWLLEKLNRPLLLEGAAGVGKTEVAKALAQAFQQTLIRLQCYEGLDVNAAVYEWNYQRQLLAIRLKESSQSELAEKEQDIFSDEYLLKRPLLQAITQAQPPVLLIDEIDRADEEFEAFLLELLSEFQISIPELGTVTATSIPKVVLTSNGTRELSDALRRRCLYQYIDYPSHDKELRIVQTRIPEAGPRLAAQVVEFVQLLRSEELRKTPGIAETLDWIAALLALKVESLESKEETIAKTLGCLLKTREDHEALQADALQRLLAKAV